MSDANVLRFGEPVDSEDGQTTAIAVTRKELVWSWFRRVERDVTRVYLVREGVAFCKTDARPGGKASWVFDDPVAEAVVRKVMFEKTMQHTERVIQLIDPSDDVVNRALAACETRSTPSIDEALQALAHNEGELLALNRRGQELMIASLKTNWRNSLIYMLAEWDAEALRRLLRNALAVRALVSLDLSQFSDVDSTEEVWEAIRAPLEREEPNDPVRVYLESANRVQRIAPRKPGGDTTTSERDSFIAAMDVAFQRAVACRHLCFAKREVR